MSKQKVLLHRQPWRDVELLPVVAVVDDERSVCEAIEGLLRSDGFEAESFGSAEALLGCPWRNQFSCIILDIGLPGMNGLDLQQRLLASGTNVPIVLVTAWDDRDGRMEAKAMGAGGAGFFRKPFDMEDLLKAVHRALAEDGYVAARSPRAPAAQG